MLNLRVRDLDAMLAQLRTAGVTIDGQETEEAAGRFAWLADPEGNRVELWEPAEDVLEPLTGVADPRPSSNGGDQAHRLVLRVHRVLKSAVCTAQVEARVYRSPAIPSGDVR